MQSVDIVIPVYNEEAALPKSIETLREFLQASDFPYQWSIVVANNASTDNTLEIARQLAAKYADVRVHHLDRKGRGRALRESWMTSPADLVCYMDVDLSTNLKSLRPLLDALTEGYDVAIGTRLARASRTTRSLKREVISRIYNLIVKAFFQTTFSDAQCGFKGLTRKAVDDLVPLIEDQSWFFDTELLVLAEKKGYRIYEVPVEWIEDLDTRVKIFRTALDDLLGLVRIRLKPIP